MCNFVAPKEPLQGSADIREGQNGMHFEQIHPYPEQSICDMHILKAEISMLQVTHGYQAAATVGILCWRCLSARTALMKQLNWKLP